MPIGVKKGGTLVMIKDEVTVNGKPRAIPKKLEANISNMEIGDKLTVDDLMIPKKVDSLDDESEVVAICKPPVKEISVVDDSFVFEKEAEVEKDTLSSRAV
jgi:large subunit ribosomal protein L25